MSVTDLHGLARGAGHVDYEGVRDLLHAVNYDSWIVLESAVEDSPETDAIKNLTFTRELMCD